MPGTILDPQTGRPERVPEEPRSLSFPRTFPNRMIRLDLRIKIMELIRPDGDLHPTMETVRSMVESVVGSDDRVRKIDSVSAFRSRYKPRIQAKVSVRQMMSRYWENFSSFALDLSGAVKASSSTRWSSSTGYMPRRHERRCSASSKSTNVSSQLCT